MKSLKTIQTLAKIAKIISRIVFIVSIVMLCLSVLGMVSVAVGGDAVLETTNSNMKMVIAEFDKDLSVADLYCTFGLSILISAGSILVSRFAVRYFENELKAGTPFTAEGAKELFSLGIMSIAASLVTSVVGSILISICKKYNGGELIFEGNNSGSIILGIVFLIFSVVFKYGAELRHNRQDANNYPDNGGDNCPPDENGGE
ncbi:MAG: hypothetical protein IJT91_03485 [Clostridia bacterium]|nr:hypothetical protein [Clostridia bacterium]